LIDVKVKEGFDQNDFVLGVEKSLEGQIERLCASRCRDDLGVGIDLVLHQGRVDGGESLDELWMSH